MCLYRPYPAGKKKSPYWAIQLSRGPDGKVVTISSKLREEKRARKMQDIFIRASESTRNGWMDDEEARKYLEEVARISRGDPLAQAEKFLSHCLQVAKRETFSIPTVTEYLSSWITEKRQADHTSESTLVRYGPILDRFAASLPSTLRLDALATRHIKDFLATEKARGVANSTSNKSIRVLSSALATAQREGLIKSNPATALTLPRETPEKRVPFTDSQVQAMMAVASAEWRGMILFGYQAGLRLWDAVQLTWANVDLANRVLTYTAQKTGKATPVRFHPEIAEYLESLPSSDDPNGKLFPLLAQQTSSSRLSALFRRHVMRRAGILSPTGQQKTKDGHQFQPLSFHSLRHSFCSRLANAEISSDVRMQMAGHASEAIHRQYTHLDLTLMDKALEKLERAA